jgi:AP endonuclease-1
VHVSAAKGPKNAVLNAHDLCCNSFALFLKNQRTWKYTALTQQSIDEFKSRMKQYSYDHKQVLPHGSYLINLGNPDTAKREKSYDAFLDDLKRCEQLDIELYNFHPGSSIGECTVDESICYISECINKAIKETNKVTIVLGNMAGQGNPQSPQLCYYQQEQEQNLKRKRNDDNMIKIEMDEYVV